MNSKLTSPLTTLFFTFFAFVAGYTLAQSPVDPLQSFTNRGAAPAALDDTFEPFWEVWQLVHQHYFEQPVDDAALAEGAIDGMLAVLGDPNTRYLSPEDQAMSRESMDGEIQGIGAEVSENEGVIVIVSPIEGSPAEAAGLQPGDILLTADGVELTGMSVVEAAALVRGPKGTVVVLGVQREGELFEVEIERDTIRVPSVRGEMLADNVAYIRLTQFGTQTDEELEELLESLLSQNPVGMILDVRRNPGGSLDTAVNIADQFLDDGRILLERFGSGREREFESTARGLAQAIPLVVLIDEGSASASEVLAGAIQDRGRGTLIGQLSFGKGTVQSWQELSNGGGVRITTAHWLTPAENWIHEQGLAPDYFIPLTESAEDAQLDAAIEFLLGNEIISIPPETQEEG